ncbi:MAG: HDIG domain-containing protein [Bacteroidales bacterium]|nr:HDIG domain-containing protein [Bacteroidales bacterium]
MKTFFSFIISNYKRVVITILFLITIFLILLIIPHQSRFKYEFRKGEPWKYETLYAPIDFPILKTKNEIDKEIDSIKNNSPLYYSYDTIVFQKAQKTLQKDISSLFINDSAYKDKNIFISNAFAQLFELYYHPGIINDNDSLLNPTNKIRTVFIQTDSSTEEFLNISFLTKEKAKQRYIQSLQDRYAKILNQLNIDKYINPNVIYNSALTNQIINQQIENITKSKGLIQKGDLLISNGEIISNKKYIILESMQHEILKNTYNPYLIIGQFLTVALGLIMIFLFLYHFRRDILSHFTKTSFILSLMILFILLAEKVASWKTVNIYLVPFTLLPIIIRSFYDSRLALFIHNITMLIIAYFLPNSFEFLFMQFMAGTASIFVLANVRRRGQLFLAAFVIFITYSIIYFGIAIVQAENINQIDWNTFAWFGGNGLMILSAYPLIYLFEKLFGFISDVTLMELSDTNQPLLRLLAEKAPGTFQHSLQVANLAEEVILKIGGNSLLVRAGALYHDIGKIYLPQYFTENQHHIPNPHKDLQMDKSIEIIAGHVNYGVEFAKKYKLPKVIIDFIETHHGTSTMLYFYRTYKLEHPGEVINQDSFKYKGKIPSTKETAVVMLADSVEAASHSLKDFSDESLEKTINAIIENKLNEHQLDNAPITLQELSITKEIFKKRLRNIYHSRITYPE